MGIVIPDVVLTGMLGFLFGLIYYDVVIARRKGR